MTGIGTPMNHKSIERMLVSSLLFSVAKIYLGTNGSADVTSVNRILDGRRMCVPDVG